MLKLLRWEGIQECFVCRHKHISMSALSKANAFSSMSRIIAQERFYVN